jgi:hypothetical protein
MIMKCSCGGRYKRVEIVEDGGMFVIYRFECKACERNDYKQLFWRVKNMSKRREHEQQMQLGFNGKEQESGS